MGEIGPSFDFRHLRAKYESAEFVAETLNFIGIGRTSKALSQFKKSLLSLLLQFNSLLHQFDQHACGAQAAAFCHVSDLPGYCRREGDALAHQSGAFRLGELAADSANYAN